MDGGGVAVLAATSITTMDAIALASSERRAALLQQAPVVRLAEDGQEVTSSAQQEISGEITGG